MKILLIGISSEVEPLGLMYLAATLKSREHIVDYQIFSNEAEANNAEIKDGYDFVGFSILTGSHKALLNLSFKYKKMSSAKTIVGNAHSTFFSDQCLEYADFVVVGEGINVINDIVEGKISNRKISPSKLSNIDNWPFPDREILYRDPKRKDNHIKNVITSFGCPFSCKYCYNDQYRALYEGFKVRLRSVESVIEECRILKNNYPLSLLFFQDDYFGYKISWLKEFSDIYDEEIAIPFHCQMRVEGVTEKKLELLKKSGCHGITIAIESSNESIRNNLLGRKMSNNQIIEACLLIKKFNFKLRTQQMIGLPDSSIDDDLELLWWNCKIKPEIAWASIFVPFRGTSLGEYCVKKGLYCGNNDDISDSFFDYTVLGFEENHRKQINNLQKIYSFCAHIPQGHILARKIINDDCNLDLMSLSKIIKKHLYAHGLYKI